MPMSSNLRKVAKEEARMDMTPMIDVTFLLLIFFMCTLHFKTLEGLLASYLPKDLGIFTSNAEKKPEEPINIKLVKSGNETVIFIGDRELKGPSKYKHLYTRVRGVVSRTPDVPAIIDPDIDVFFQDIISTLNTCRRVSRDLQIKPIEVKFSAQALDEQPDSEK